MDYKEILILDVDMKLLFKALELAYVLIHVANLKLKLVDIEHDFIKA